MANEHLPTGSLKPPDPKSALVDLLGQQKKPLSGRLHVRLAHVITLANCQDRAFSKFRDTLRRWFPAR